MLNPGRLIGQIAVYAAIAAALWFWHAHQVSQYRDEVLRIDRAAQARTVLLLQEQMTTLKGELHESEQTYAAEKQALVDLVGRFADADRVRVAETERFKRSLANASKQATREYAEDVDANYERSRTHIVRFGHEAADCAATAHRLNRDLDAYDRHWEQYVNTLKIDQYRATLRKE